MKNILHININYLTTSLHQTMVGHLDCLDIKSTVFAPTYDKRQVVVSPDENVIVSECFHKWNRVNFYYKQKKIRNALENNVKVQDYDLIHAYTLFSDGNCAYELSRKYGVPYVVAVRNTDVNVFLRHMVYLRNRGIEILLSAVAVFFLSPAYKEKTLNQYVPGRLRDSIEKKSYIIPNGIDDFWFENKFIRVSDEFLKNAKVIRLIYAGRIGRNKNIPLTLKAIDILKKEGWTVYFTVVGNVEDKKEFQTIIAHPSVNYHRSMPKEKLIDEYRKSDIFVMPSHTETFGLVYAEAMSQGLPVIYTKDQGFDGQFLEGEVGYHVSDRDENDIVLAIKDIVKKYKRISNACSGLCEKFRWDCICERYKNVYDSCK